MKVTTQFSDDDSHNQMCILAVLSHGAGKSSFYSRDGKEVDMEDIIGFFDNENCKALFGRPKFFIVNACRGQKADRGVAAPTRLAYADETDSVPYQARGEGNSLALKGDIREHCV